MTEIGYENLRLTKKDHDKIKKLLNLIEKDKDFSLFEEFKKEIFLHNEAEKAFYEPLQDKAGKLKIMVKAGHEEHNLTMKMMKQLDKINNDDEKMSLFSVIKKSLEAHIIMEEEDLFTLSKEHFSNQEAQEMAGRMAKIKEKYEKHYKG